MSPCIKELSSSSEGAQLARRSAVRGQRADLTFASGKQQMVLLGARGLD